MEIIAEPLVYCNRFTRAGQKKCNGKDLFFYSLACKSIKITEYNSIGDLAVCALKYRTEVTNEREKKRTALPRNAPPPLAI